MIYLASRSHQKYLDKLDEIARRPESYHLVSITGGLAFLHAISDRTQSLTLVDSDPEVNEYARAMIEALVRCTTRAEFFGLLTGKTLASSEGQVVRFMECPYDDRQRIFTMLSASTRQIIERWYYGGTFDIANAQLSVEDKTVHFTGHNLTPQHFNWHTERECLKTEDSYRLLNQNLARLNPRFETIPLEQFPFEACASDTLVLASNTDSPLFTQNDAILRAVEHKGKGRCSYVSRTRGYSRKMCLATAPLGESELSMAPVAVGFPSECEGSISKTFAKVWNFLSVEGYLQQPLYDQECLLFFTPSDMLSADKLLRHLQQQLPIHQRVGFLSTNAVAIGELLPELMLSYQVVEEVSIPQPGGLLLKGQLYELKSRTPYRQDLSPP